VRILAIDTALDTCAACVMAEEVEAPLAAESLPMARGHAESLLPLIERVIARALSQLMDPAMPRPTPCDTAGILAVGQAALLSARTGQTESPATIRQIVALA